MITISRGYTLSSDNMPNHWMVKNWTFNNSGYKVWFIWNGFAYYWPIVLVLSAQIFLPKRVSKREKEIEMKRDKQAQKRNCLTALEKI